MGKYGGDARSTDSGIGSSTGGSVYSEDSRWSEVSQREVHILYTCAHILKYIWYFLNSKSVLGRVRNNIHKVLYYVVHELCH